MGKGVAVRGPLGRHMRAQRCEGAYGGLTALWRVGQGRECGKARRERCPSQRLLRGRRVMRERVPTDKPRPGKRHVKITHVARDIRLRGLRPGEHLCIGAVTPFRGQRARHVHHGMRVGLKGRESQGPIPWGLGERTERSGQGVECLVQVCAGDYLRTSIIGVRTCRGTHEKHGVRNPGEHLRAKQWTVEDVLAGLSERDQVTGEVATVDRGHV